MTPLETLKAARQLITDPAKWTQGELARDAEGNEINPNNDLATCFCAHGAIQYFTADETLSNADILLIAVCSDKHDCYVEDYNDTHTHAEVIALFDAAIAGLEGVA
jgi:hypothetical protein